MKRFFMMEIKDNYPSFWSVLGMAVGVFVSLYVYWFTSKAFSPVIGSLVDSPSLDYFTFVLTGELILMLPLLIIEAPVQVIKQSVSQGSLETLLLLPGSHQRPLLMWVISRLPSEIFRLIFTLGLAAILFPLNFSFWHFLQAMFIAIISLPLFLGFGLFAASIYVIFGRGERALLLFSNLASIFSGLYFPVNVLPNGLQTIIRGLSPFYLVLDNARKALSGAAAWQSEAFFIFILGLMIFIFGYLALGMAFSLCKWRGSNFLLRY